MTAPSPSDECNCKPAHGENVFDASIITTTRPRNRHENEDRHEDARDFRFYAVLGGLLLAALLSFLEGSTMSTALPTIAADLNLGPTYVWVADSYFLTMAAFQPLFGQLADLWGRRWILIMTVMLFLLGSGLIGGAQTGAILLAGRAIQGTGAGGINMMVDLVVCDLVPLREMIQSSTCQKRLDLLRRYIRRPTTIIAREVNSHVRAMVVGFCPGSFGLTGCE